MTESDPKPTSPLAVARRAVEGARLAPTGQSIRSLHPAVEACDTCTPSTTLPPGGRKFGAFAKWSRICKMSGWKVNAIAAIGGAVAVFLFS